MSTTTPSARVIKDQVNVITLKCAQDWHRAFKEQNDKGFAPGDMPPSIVIPIADVVQIVNDFRETVQENVNGVRMYFIIKPGRKQNGKPHISAICVPTIGPHLNKSEVSFTDLIIKAERREGAPVNPDVMENEGGKTLNAVIENVSGDSGDDYVSIYDVTRPCPPFCDPESDVNG